MKPEGCSEPTELLRQQTIIAEFGELALRSDDLDEILSEACRLVGAALGTDLAKVVELQADGKTLLVRAGIGWKEGVVGVVTIETAENTSEGYALKSGEPMVSPDISKETRFEYAPFLIEHGAKAVANVIILGGKGRPPFGILQVDSREPRDFTESDLTFLRGYANLLAATVDRLRALNESRATGTRLQLALDAGELGSFELDLATGEITRSPRVDEIFGHSRTGARWTQERGLVQVVPDDRPRICAAVRDCGKADGHFHEECRIVRMHDRGECWIEIQGRLIDEQAPGRLVGVVADITERREMQQSLEAANAKLEAEVSARTRALQETNAQLDAFTYTVSHDLRAPLRAMEGFATILLEDHRAALGEEGAKVAMRIVNAAKRMEVLICDLLAFSRMQRAEVALENVDPARVIRRIVSELHLLSGADVDVALDQEPVPRVRADRTILGQVLENLLVNAAKFHHPGRAPRVAVRFERWKSRVRIWVEDDGIGISPEHHQRIFNVFERLHGQETYLGTGVGLAIVKTGMERMGGTYGVESTVGEGSRFWIELLAAVDAATASAQGTD